MAQHDNHEFRLAALEKQSDKLDKVHEIVTRLDERFDKIDTIYDNRTSALEKTSENHGKDIDDLKTFKWKAVGTISLVLVLISVFGTAIGNAIVKKFVSPAANAQQTGYISPTNSTEFLQAKDRDNLKGSSQLMQPPGKLSH